MARCAWLFRAPSGQRLMSESERGLSFSDKYMRYITTRCVCVWSFVFAAVDVDGLLMAVSESEFNFWDTCTTHLYTAHYNPPTKRQ